MNGLMVSFLIIGVVVFIFSILCMTSYLRIEMVYRRTDDSDTGYVLFSMFKGLLHYRLRLSKIEFEGITKGVEIQVHTGTDKEESRVSPHTIKKTRHRYQQLINRVPQFHGTIHWFLSKVICERLSWSTSIGTGNAMETGIVVGTVWGLVSTVLASFGRYIQWNHAPELEVVPDFQRTKLESKVHFIIRFRIGNAMRGMLRLLVQLRSRRSKEED